MNGEQYVQSALVLNTALEQILALNQLVAVYRLQVEPSAPPEGFARKFKCYTKLRNQKY